MHWWKDGAPDFSAKCETIFLGDVGERDLDFYYWSVQLLILKPRFLTSDCFIWYAFFKRSQKVPDQIRCYNRVVVDGIEALCIFLMGFAYARWYFDMLSRFARPVPQLCMTSNQVMDFIYQTHHHHLKNFNQPWLSQASLQNYMQK